MNTTLLHSRDIRALAAALGLRPTKTLGQNFVTDAGTVSKIVRLAGVEDSGHVVEVGPGLGSLTLALLEQDLAVTAVEIDPVLAEQLPATIRTHQPDRLGQFRLINADALEVDHLAAPMGIDPSGRDLGGRFGFAGEDPRLGEPVRALVANLPYNVSVPIVLHFLSAFPTIERALVMVQSEVADRMVASSGSRIYGVPSVKIAWYGTARKVATIGRSVFWPVPNVDSALVLIERTVLPQTQVSREEVFAVVDAAFAQRRKTLRAALSRMAGAGGVAEGWLRAAAIDPRTRGEQLDVSDYIRLAEAVRADRSNTNPPEAGH